MNSIVSADALAVISELLPAKMPPRPPAPFSGPFWQAEPCPAWCTNLHRESDHFEDRQHWATAESVDLSLYRAEYGDDGYGPGELVIGATQHYRGAEPEIDLTVPTTSEDPYAVAGEQGVRLTVGEARALRDRLSGLLAAVEGDGLDVDLVAQIDGCSRQSAEQVIEFNTPFESGDFVRAHLTQWTERDSDPALEVTIDADVTVRGCTPGQARDAANRLREAADTIDALAECAEKANAAALPAWPVSL